MKRIKRIISFVVVASCLALSFAVYAGELTSGSKTVSSAGTAERLIATDTLAHWVDVQADCSNTGSVFVGGSAVSSSAGIELTPCSAVTVSHSGGINLKNVFVDSAVNSEGVLLNYMSYP